MALLTSSVDRVSTSSAGAQGNAFSALPAFAPDGTSILFSSLSTNFIPGDTAVEDIFIKNLLTGDVIRVTEAADGTPANDDGGGQGGRFSPDGTLVVFASQADNLVPGDSNGTWDIFIKNLTTGDVVLVSETATGTQPDNISLNPVFSPDGGHIAFTSLAGNLVAGAAGPQVYAKDLATGDLTLLSANAAGEAANGASFNGAFSPDGAFFTFSSFGDNLTGGADTNELGDIFVKNLTTGEVALISMTMTGVIGNGESFNPVFSPDGTRVMFSSFADNLVANDTNGVADIFIRDLTTGVITLVSGTISGTVGNGPSNAPSWSPDGTKVVFESFSTNFVAEDNNAVQDIFIKDLVTGEVSLVSKGATQPGDGHSRNAVWSPDGTRVLYESEADNLVAGDTNGATDVFIATVIDSGTIQGSHFDDVFSGTANGDTINALPGNDIVHGGDGNDTINGGSGNDTLYGDNGNDSLSGGNGDDTLYGGKGNDNIHGGAGHDALHGGASSDLLYGDDGDDALYGGTGTNWLTGGAGADRFALTVDAFDGHADKITDFSAAQGDYLYLEDILFGFDASGSIVEFLSGLETGGDTVLSIDRDGTGGTYEAEQVAILKGLTGIDIQTLFDDGAIFVGTGV